MNISYNWLLDYAQTHLTPTELAHRFRLTSSEVDGIEDWSKRLEGLVVGVVTDVSDHPNAHSLHLTKVDIGKDTPLSIVCGAPNVTKGMHVIVALPGITITNTRKEQLTLEERAIRGERSQGMLCAAEEIGLPLPSDGIMELSPDTEPGTPAADALNLNDSVLDMEITPNRPDLLSHYGLAREICAFDKKPLQEPPLAVFEDSPSLEHALHIQISDSRLCPRYSAICCDVTVSPSPQWIQSRLLVAGIRPINNVVDITNYVLLELGQPLHAFDAKNIASYRTKSTSIEVRSARKDEKITTLDGTVRQLQSGDIVISETNGEPIALAGIMGGASAEISESTERIIIESANFHATSVRRTSRRMNLRSEASTRFEKGLDPEQTVTALKRAYYLLEKFAGAKMVSPLADKYPKRTIERPRISITFDRIEQILGAHINVQETKYILQKLGFQLPHVTKSSFETVPPSWRADVKLPEDVIEELVRLWGYSRLPSTMPCGPIKPPYPNGLFDRKNKIRRTLAEESFNECVTLSFTSGTNLEKSKIPLDTCIALPNPLSEEVAYLKPSHLPLLLQTVSSQGLGNEPYNIFEIGKVFTPPTKEEEVLSFLISGKQGTEDLYRSIKSVLQHVTTSAGLPAIEYRTDSDAYPWLSNQSVLSLRIGSHAIGHIGLLHPEVVQKWKIRGKQAHLYGEISLDRALALPVERVFYKEPSSFPSVERDITLLVDSTVPAQKVIDTLGSYIEKTDLVERWHIDTIYSGAPIPESKKAVTIHFVYNARTRTLRDEEVNTHQNSLAKHLSTTLQASVA